MKRRSKRWWTRLVTVAASLIVAAAALSAAFAVLVDAVPGWRQRVEAGVSAQIGSPVRIGTMALVWRHLRPTLELRDLVVLGPDATPSLSLARLRLGLSPSRLLTGPRSPDRIEADGLRLGLRIDADGRPHIDGVRLASGSDPARLDALARHAELRLLDVTLRLQLEPLQPEPLTLTIPRASLRHGRGGYHLDADGQLPPSIGGGALQVQAQIDGRFAEPEAAAGQWRLAIDALSSSPWLDRRLAAGSRIAFDGARVSATGRIEHGRPALSELRLRSAAITGYRDDRPRARLAGLDLRAVLEPQAGGWQLRLPQAVIDGHRGPWQADGLALARHADGEIRLQAPLLRLDDLAPWLALLPGLPEAAGTLAGLRGDLARLRLERRPVTDGTDPLAGLALHADLQALALDRDPDTVAPDGGDAPDEHGRGIGFSGLAGRLELRHARGLLQLDGAPLTLDLPSVFAEPLPLHAAHGLIGFERDAADGSLRIGSNDLQLELPGGLQTGGTVDVRLPGSDTTDAGTTAAVADAPPRWPHLRADLAVRADDVPALKPWMPVTWGPNSRAWLQRALDAAQIRSGRFRIDAALPPRVPGQPQNIPWQLELTLAGTRLAFAPDWPAIENLGGRLRFHDGGLSVDADQGRLAGLELERLHADIPELRAAKLALDARFHGDAADLYRLFRDSPLAGRTAGLTGNTVARGPIRGDLTLALPLDEPKPVADARGTLRLDGIELAVHGLPTPLRALRGDIAYGRSLAAEGLSARLHDTPIRAEIVRGPDDGGDAPPTAELRATLAVEPGRDDGLAADFLPRWLRAELSGTTQLALRLPLIGGDGRLRLSSDLRGVGSTLPAPLTKSADTALPVRLQFGAADTASPASAASAAPAPPPPIATRLDIAVADQLRLALHYPARPAPTAATAATTTPAAAPPAERGHFDIRGAPTALDIAGWIDLIVRSPSAADVPTVTADADADADADAATVEPALALGRIDLRPARSQLRRWTYGDSRLQVQPLDNAGRLRVQLDGSAVGTIDWDPAAGGRVTARLQRLALDALTPLPLPEPGAAPPESPFNPTRAPLFDIDAADVHVGDVALGRLQIVTSRIADGQRIEQLSLADGRLSGSAEGAWRRRDGGDRDGSSAELAFELRSDAIADVLRVFGYTPNISADEARFTGNVVWPRVPAGLELSQATGTVGLRLARGQLKAVEPGAGRVLGLVNLYALPRRLLFDFRDVVDEGLRFDRLRGGFRLADGDARTDDLDIDGPSVKIELRGRIGLAARDFDQRVTVLPDISTGVTVGATLLGGPIAGGILLVAQQLFDKPFNQIGAFHYRVTGGWDDPTVTRGEVQPAPAATLPPVTPAAPTAPEAHHG